MNESTVLVLVERHKLEQDAATGIQFALGQNTVHIGGGGGTGGVYIAQTLYLHSG